VKLAGLSNLAQTLKPQAAAKGTSLKDAKASSFEEVLGKERSLRESSTSDSRVRKPEQERSEVRKPEARAEQNRPEPKQANQGRSETPAQTNQERSPNNERSRERSPEPRAASTDPIRSPDSSGNAQATDVNVVEGNGLDAGTMPGQGLPPSVTNPLNDRVGVPTLVMGQGAAKAGMLGKGPEEGGVDSLTRRVVWNDFLRKMKDEFGVSAEDVLQAFGSLSDEELAQPPAESVDKVILALGLNDQQSVIAKQYFQDLIAKTQSRSIGEELNGSSKQIRLSLMTEREMQRKALDRSLVQMNSNFFMNGGMPPGARPIMPAPNMETPAVPNSIKTSESQDANAHPSLAALTPDFAAPPIGEAVTSTANAVTPPMAAPVAALGKAPVSPQQRALDELTAQMQPVDSKDKSVDQLLQKFMQGQAPLGGAKGMSAAAAAPAMEAASAANAAASAAPAGPTISASALNGLLAALDADSSGSEESGQEFSDANYMNAPLAAAGSKLDAPIASAQDFQAALGQVKPGAPMDVPELVQQAQLMVRDGGGEMKVTLNQEGLGEVAMRVSVDQGKVNVQMITESDEAKKLIERGLSELKSSLTSNNLQVSDIKIDTATNLGKQLEQQYQDAQRQMTQSGWEQFRQDNQGWRRGFFDTASARVYKGQGEAPRDVQAPTGPASRRAGSQRLNLVA